jgi:SagB-type dehydrogenase family enzyme
MTDPTDLPDLPDPPLDRVRYYHERSKHQPNAYAHSLGYLDWNTQPDPFRHFAGAPQLPLDHPPLADLPAYDALFQPGRLVPQPLDRATISQLFYDSLALSAWKQADGSRWSLRINPSSGDLHPTEGYLIAGPIAGLSDDPAVYHYSPFQHALEQRRLLAPADWATLADTLPAGAVLLALTSIYWREAWKYGERAFRYCHHDVGHAIGAVTLAAAALGWQTRLVETVATDPLAVLLGVHRQPGCEAEHPDGLLALFPSPVATAPTLHLPTELVDRLTASAPLGTENRLSQTHHDWPIIAALEAATRYPGQPTARQPAPVSTPSDHPAGLLSERPIAARRILHQRRSAVAMDRHTHLDRATFYHLLARVTPRHAAMPFQVLPWPPRVSLALFVHRVHELPAGLYLLLRDPAHEAPLRAALHPTFDWRKPAGCPAGLDCYLLQAGDARDAARFISCHQDIAADGALSLGMLAAFETGLDQDGPWGYPRLFWETGLIGQVLYLEAEAAGVRATGIGCFFDDLMHQVLGIGNHAWQSLYHFTLGGPVEDRRLRTLPPYFHLGKAVF